MAELFPDLLAATPTRRLDRKRTTEALTFGFAQGTSSDAWDRLYESADLPPTKWDEAAFARDLFVPELVATMREVAIDGTRHLLGQRWLERLLSRPPADQADVQLRRDVLRELDASSRREELRGLFASIRRLRAQLSVSPVRSVDVLRRRLEILATLRSVLDDAAAAFAGAQSALSRIPRWAESVRATNGYRALVELLDYDERLATVDVRVRVGADGRVRGLALARIEENAQSRFAKTPFGRWIARLVLLFRGYRFDAEELLARAVEQVFDDLQDAMVALVQLAADLELHLAALAFREQAERAGLRVCLPEVRTEGGRELRRLFNPLLLIQERRVVPCDVVGDADRIVLLTGPNSGGKTRLLQAIGLSQLLAQCGLYVPAESARLAPASALFASFGQPPAADASEGRLGTELLRVRALFETMSVGGMVLVDELCSGTNPSEGEELFRLVLSLLGELEPQAFLSTHFLSLTAELQREPPSDRLSFLQVELDEHGAPTYQFVPGVATTSLAQRTAARLGVTREDLAGLVQKAKRAARG